VTGQARTASTGHERTRAAAVSIASNAFLIVLKLFAGAATGSVAILTEAIHSAIDLIASCIAYFSVRQARSPPTPSTATATRSSRTSPRRPRAC
jgi:divalent metal cation (Fe/Co/Zn/Cd) transporter